MMNLDYSVWAPCRDSNATRACMAALRLRIDKWEWGEHPYNARWWIVDGTQEFHDALVDTYAAMDIKPRVAFLAHRLADLPEPAWTYFRVPIESRLLFSWLASVGPASVREDFLHSALQPTLPPAAEQEWRHKRFYLTRWPNISRYGGSLDLTVACSKLLAKPARFDELVNPGLSRELLERFLADAEQDGILRFQPDSSSGFHPSQLPAPAPAPSGYPIQALAALDASGSAAPEEHSRWSLVKRILGKFSFK